LTLGQNQQTLGKVVLVPSVVTRTGLLHGALGSWLPAVSSGGGTDQGAIMSSDSDQDSGQAIGAAIGAGLVVGQMRKVERNLVAATTPVLTQGEKLLVVAPTRSAGLPLKGWAWCSPIGG
jgi:hypothetical protein